MGFSTLVNFAIEAVGLMLMTSMPAVITAAAIGVAISLVQALTQVQEQTLGFAFKLIGVVLALLAMMEGAGASFYLFARRVFDEAGRWSI